MKLSELINAHGDDLLQFQLLDQCAASLDMRGDRTKITFYTDMRLNLSGTEKLGVVVWLDRDKVKAITAASAPAGEGGAS